MKKINSQIILGVIAAVFASMSFISCKDTKSYSELLFDEKVNINAFLANQRVINEVPADSAFEVGPNAPYYRMDEEGNVYMQVLDRGNGERPVDDEVVYFRYTRYDLGNYAVSDSLPAGAGNADNMEVEPTWFRLNNYRITASSQYGMGIQLPMTYLNYNAKVNIVLKSQYGFTSEIALVTPFLYNISYYKPAV
ncbi:MAG: DUF4827 domain-containing protein [Muribaculaceae bacterium]|nr:DUF4827 domain-containing protein [Muribaculaceae bacterium]